MFAGVVEWQTRWLQVPVVAIPCGFKSHLLHYIEKRRTEQSKSVRFLCGESFKAVFLQFVDIFSVRDKI